MVSSSSFSTTRLWYESANGHTWDLRHTRQERILTGSVGSSGATTDGEFMCSTHGLRDQDQGLHGKRSTQKTSLQGI